MRYNYTTPNPDPYPDAVSIPSIIDGVAWYVLGVRTVPTEDTEWTGMEEETGDLVVRMVGDDKHWLADPSDIVPLAREDYCSICGQIGCCHDGYPREEVPNV